MKDEGLFHLIDPKAWDTDWNAILPQLAPDIKRLNIFPNMYLKLPYPTIGSRLLKMEKLLFVTEKPEPIEIVGLPYQHMSLSGDTCSMFYPQDL
jgi:hypothetical protein